MADQKSQMRITILCYGETETQVIDYITKLEFYKDASNNARVNITVGDTGRAPIPFYVDDLQKVEVM